jgi:predicted small metal-binding protein
MPVAYVITCDLCGLAVQGNTEDETVSKAADHLDASHPDMARDVTLNQLRARVEEV